MLKRSQLISFGCKQIKPQTNTNATWLIIDNHGSAGELMSLLYSVKLANGNAFLVAAVRTRKPHPMSLTICHSLQGPRTDLIGASEP